MPAAATKPAGSATASAGQDEPARGLGERADDERHAGGDDERGDDLVAARRGAPEARDGEDEEQRHDAEAEQRPPRELARVAAGRRGR